MPYVIKKQYDEMNKALTIVLTLRGELKRHNDFVLKYQGTFASMNSDSNFAELKGKRDLLNTILTVDLGNIKGESG